MPLEDLSVIDMMFRKDGRLVLVITDSGVTSDPAQRERLMKAKLNLYAHALAQDEFQQEHPDFRTAKIRVTCAAAPEESLRAIAGVKVSPQQGESFQVPIEFHYLENPYVPRRKS
jgi:hypothetical protein